ncbi:MAG: DUF1036 domain-containing protein [Alphaproteobacteria bacterium]
MTDRSLSMVRQLLVLARTPLVLGLAVLALSAAASPAEASLSLCNHTSYVIRSSVALPQPDGWRVEGWSQLRPGECRQILKKLSAVPSFYVYAESNRAHEGAVRKWTGKRKFCVREEDFVFSGPRSCNDHQEFRSFFRVQIEAGAKEWVHRFSEPVAQHVTLRQARFSGIQRLLIETGYLKGNMDGHFGRKSSQAARAARKALNLGSIDLDSFEMIDGLLKSIETEQDARGFRVCNKTDHRVVVSVAYDREGTWVSRGWWAPEPGACMKLIKDRLPDRFIYVYVSGFSESGDSVVWDGSHPFCISDVKFSIEGSDDCAERGYGSAKFVRIDTEDQSGWTYDLLDTKVPEQPAPFEVSAEP